jgi:DNA-binding response OmpR family regulator
VSEGARILIISDHDEVTGPLTETLRRTGYRVEISSSRDGPEELRATRPDLLIVDDHQPAPSRLEIRRVLQEYAEGDSTPAGPGSTA